MKVLQFTIPVAMEHTVVVQEDRLPFFYNHLHRHNEAQLTWIREGEGTLIAGNYMQPFKPGDIYLLAANQPHIFKSDPLYFKKNSKKLAESLTIFFNPEGSFAPILAIPESKAIKKFITNAGAGLKFPKNSCPRIGEGMLAVKNAKLGFRLAEFIRLLQTLSNLKDINALATVPEDYQFSDNEGLRMNDVYQYTMNHFTENIKLKQVADIACLTPHAFCRYFKKHTRKTFVAFLSEIRISEACKAIVNGNYNSISSIAYDSGFNSAVSFNRVFKKITSKSPKEYLKEYRQKINQAAPG